MWNIRHVSICPSCHWTRAIFERPLFSDPIFKPFEARFVETSTGSHNSDKINRVYLLFRLRITRDPYGKTIDYRFVCLLFSMLCKRSPANRVTGRPTLPGLVLFLCSKKKKRPGSFFMTVKMSSELDYWWFDKHKFLIIFLICRKKTLTIFKIIVIKKKNYTQQRCLLKSFVVVNRFKTNCQYSYVFNRKKSFNEYFCCSKKMSFFFLIDFYGNPIGKELLTGSRFSSYLFNDTEKKYLTKTLW